MQITSRPRRRIPRATLLALGALVALPLAGCAAQEAGTDDPTATASDAATERSTAEESTSKPRLAITYDGGLQILDATTLEVLADIPLDGFNRLNPAGDERHAFVSTEGGFQVLDLGAWAEPHGDHSHYYSTDPALLDVTYPAEVPGHVVVHGEHTVLFDDGTGEVTVLETADVAAAAEPVRTYTTPTPHHGVAVQLDDGTLVVSEGTEDARTGIVALDGEDQPIAQSQDCPGVHGEAVADDETVLVGCQDGALVYHDGVITKVVSPDEYGRIGNLRAAPGSDVVLGDYNADPDGATLTQVALIDVATDEITLVDVGAEYTFRSLARDDEGHALVLGTDGQIHVIDPTSGTVEQSIPVIDEWVVPEDWQEPRPTLLMLDGSAYVTDPATNRVLAVDIATGEVWAETTLDVTANEIVGTTGDVVDGVSHDHDGEDGDHDHSDEHTDE